MYDKTKGEKIKKGMGNFKVIGCRMHWNEKECRGKLIEKVSKFGARVVHCEAGWAGIEEGLWSNV